MRRKLITFLLTLAVVLGCLVPATAQAAVPRDFTGISGSYLYVAGRKLKTPSRQLTKVSKYDSVTAAAYTYTTYELDGKTYALTGAGKLKKNMIVGSGEDMYYYDATGARVEDPAIQAAVQFVKQYGGRRTKAAVKIKNCFNQLATASVYPNQEAKNGANFASARMLPAAMSVLQDGYTGDSFVKSSAMAYVARVLGYEANVTGFRMADGDGGSGPHGYTAVKYGKTFYIFDVEKNLYKKKLTKFPYTVMGDKEILKLEMVDGNSQWTGESAAVSSMEAVTPEPVNASSGMHIQDGYLYLNDQRYVGNLCYVPAARAMSNQSYSYFAVRLNGQQYAFDQEGKMYTDQIIGMGIYACYYGKDGIMVDDDIIVKAVEFVKAHGGSGNSRADKLKSCYLYLSDRDHYVHNGDHTNKICTIPTLPDAANRMLNNVNSGKGNCFCWGAAFAYIGRVLGYDTGVLRTEIAMVHGGWTAHGMTSIRENASEKWKVCDPNMQWKRSYWMKTIGGTYPSKLNLAEQTYFDLCVENGTAYWRLRP